MEASLVSRFRLWTGIALVLVYCVITAGAIVRATGSGMGCPDWPKCFGQWIPPTDESELPADYQEKYAGEHNAVAVFNVYQTWTEYLNRLCGALLGIAALVTCIFGYLIRKEFKTFFLLSVSGLLLIGFEAWLGKTVVDSNLAPVKITLHMVMALLIVAVYLYILSALRQKQDSWIPGIILKRLLWISILFSLIQVVLGTQVRESVDEISAALGDRNRSFWLSLLDQWFLAHRSFSILVVVLNLYIYYKLRNTPLWTLMNMVMIIIAIEAGLGIVISYLGFPAWAQPLHLILAAVMFGLQAGMMFRIGRNVT